MSLYQTWLEQVSCYLAAAKERVFCEKPINLMHQFKCLSIQRRVCNRLMSGWSSADYVGVSDSNRYFFVDHLAAFWRAHRFSTCDKKLLSPANRPIMACRSLISLFVLSAVLTLSENMPVYLQSPTASTRSLVLSEAFAWLQSPEPFCHYAAP